MPPSTLPSGTVTFLFTDIEGSTALARSLGTERWHEVLTEHGRVMREALSDGHEIRVEGDAFFVVFESAGAAVRGAAAAQRALHATPWPHGGDLRVRMGLHSGEGTPADPASGADYVGYAVHRAARVAAAANGGQVLLSGATVALVDDLGDGLSLRDLGEHRLKDLARPERLYQLDIAGLTGEFPPPRTLERAPHNLPVQLTSFVGRQREVREASALLAGARLLTLVGPGGTGKTRLSLQLAAEAIDQFPDGVFFVALAPITEAGLVPTAIARSLGVQPAGTRPVLDQVVEHMRERRLLLVLDNFEQVLDAATVVTDILRAAPAVKVMVTSRAPLRVSGEQEYAVPPLGLPDPSRLPDAAALSQYEAVHLFIERAVAAKHDFRVTNENAPAVAEICARLDGLPLAIELAAARVRLLTPQAMLSRLASILDSPSAGARDLPARQRTLHGAISWSYELLDEGQRRLFRRLAVFSGGAQLEQIEAVCDAPEPAAGDLLGALEGLVEQSLVRQREVSGEPRFSMLQTIREFAAGRLDESGEDDASRERHAHVYADLAEGLMPHLFGDRQRETLDRFELEHDNIRSALDCAIRRDAFAVAARLGAGTWRFWQMRGLLVEGRMWMERVLAMPDREAHPRELMGALEAAGGITYWQFDRTATARHYGELVRVAESVGDRAAVANAYYNRAFANVVLASSNETFLDEALSAGVADHEHALAIWRELGDEAGVAKALWGLGTAFFYKGDMEQARRYSAEAETLFARQGNNFGLGWAKHMLALVALDARDTAQARACLREALDLFTAADDLSGVVLVVADYGFLAEIEGRHDIRYRLAGAMDVLKRETGTGILESVQRHFGKVVPDEPTPEQVVWLDEGRALTREQAIAIAMELDRTPAG